MKRGPKEDPFVATKQDIQQIKELIDTNSTQTISILLHIPREEINKIVTKLKLI